MATILLVEDDEDIRDLVILRLETAGLDVEFAENGQIGLDMALAKKYDLILMDMHMPILDGHDAIKQLRKFGYEGKIVGLTASAMVNETHRALLSGCNDVIIKPITEEFEDQVKSYI
jgi:CheY-like chemotaxis protein